MDTLKNARHERFAQLLAEGQSQADAYRAVYPASRYWKADSLHHRASKVHAKVLPRVREMQQAGVSKTILTRNELAAYLSRVIVTPVGEIGRDSPLVQSFEAGVNGVRVCMVSKIAACEQLAKLMGWYAPERADITFQFKPDANVFEALSQAAGRGPSLSMVEHGQG